MLCVWVLILGCFFFCFGGGKMIGFGYEFWLVFFFYDLGRNEGFLGIKSYDDSNVSLIFWREFEEFYFFSSCF